MSTFKKLALRFLASTQGDTAIMFALSAIPVLLATGAGIDYARHNSAQTHLQAALDAAALAGAAAVGKTDAERIAAAQATFDANVATGSVSGYTFNSDFSVSNGTLIASASVDMPTALMHLAGIEDMAVEGTAEVGIATEKKAEIALVLDYSGSMGEWSGGKVKYVAMKEAASKLVSDLAAASPGKVKFGLVPFSHHVYLSMSDAFVVGGSGSSTWTGCTQDRQYPHNLTDNTPTSANKSKWGHAFAPEHAYWGCDGYASNNLVVKPLTTDHAAINNQLATMYPYAWTHIALGVEFGYHVLSENLPFDQGVSYGDTETEKFMIVLTDGMQTEPAFGPGTTRTVAQGESNLSSLCENAKNDGIRIITLAFDLDDTSTRTRLRNCASDADSFFIADDATDLSLAFEDIKTAIASEVYLKK